MCGDRYKSHLMTAVPCLFGTEDQFHGRQFFHGPGVGGWFGDDSSALHFIYLCNVFTLHLLCNLLLLLLHLFHLRSWTTRSQRLGTPDLTHNIFCLDFKSYLIWVLLCNHNIFQTSSVCILLPPSLYIFMMEIILSNPS